MILVPVDQLEHHAAVLPHWPAVKAFLDRPDLATLEPGRVEIAGDDVFAIVADDVAREAAPPLEAHRRYLDVQLAVRGSFDVLWHPLAACTQVRAPYEAEHDVLLMDDVPHTRLHLTPGVAAVFYPDDAHAPLPPADQVRKIVVKVALSGALQG